jgi:hypothetical protein
MKDSIHEFVKAARDAGLNFGIKHVRVLRISYTSTSKNLKDEYEGYAWKRNKNSVEEDDRLGMEDPKRSNQFMSAARYFLTEMLKANADPEASKTPATTSPSFPRPNTWRLSGSTGTRNGCSIQIATHWGKRDE